MEHRPCFRPFRSGRRPLRFSWRSWGQGRNFEHGAERFDGTPVRLAVLREFQEVMVEGSMDHAVVAGDLGLVAVIQIGSPARCRKAAICGSGSRLHVSETLSTLSLRCTMGPPRHPFCFGPILVAEEVGFESTSFVETKEFCGAARPSQ